MIKSIQSLESIPKERLLNDTDARGRSYLHRAIVDNDHAAVRYLLDAGANPNVLDRHQLSALQYAAWKGSLPVVRRLLRAGAATKHFDIFGMTPLFKAVGYSHGHIVRCLVVEGHADVNLPQAPVRAPAEYEASSFRDTALHLAARKGDAPMCTLLLRLGANVLARNAAAETPLETAARRCPPLWRSTKLVGSNQRGGWLQRWLSGGGDERARQRQIAARGASSSWAALEALLSGGGDERAQRELLSGKPLRLAPLSVRLAVRSNTLPLCVELRKALGLE